MSYRMVVWREAGTFGPAGSFSARKDLGTHTLSWLPEPGDTLVIRGEEWKVSEVHVGFLYVRPMKQIIS